MAPLLFPNLALLVLIGLWRLRAHLPGGLTPEPRLSRGGPDSSAP